MKFFYLTFALIIGLGGCKEAFVIDTVPPAPPIGIRATALDNAIEITWVHNTEPDLAGYKVWVSDRYDGKYTLLGRIKADQFVDNGARNGARYYYGLTAYDFDGNESDLTRDVVYATARPEGFGTSLLDYRAFPNSSGYDFSTYSIGQYDDKFTDVFFEHHGGRFYLNVWDDTDIQDMGYTYSLYDISQAPAAGWTPSKSVEAIKGHTYVIWTWDDHYAKIRVRDVNSSRVMFDWAYQIAAANPDLKRVIPQNGRAHLTRSAAIALQP